MSWLSREKKGGRVLNTSRVCCSVLQCVGLCSSVLQRGKCVAACYSAELVGSVLQRGECLAVRYSLVHCDAARRVCCSVLQRVAVLQGVRRIIIAQITIWVTGPRITLSTAPSPKKNVSDLTFYFWWHPSYYQIGGGNSEMEFRVPWLNDRPEAVWEGSGNRNWDRDWQELNQ